MLGIKLNSPETQSTLRLPHWAEAPQKAVLQQHGLRWAERLRTCVLVDAEGSLATGPQPNLEVSRVRGTPQALQRCVCIKQLLDLPGSTLASAAACARLQTALLPSYCRAPSQSNRARMQQLRRLILCSQGLTSRTSMPQAA